MVSGIFPGKQGVLSQTRGKPALGSNSRETVPSAGLKPAGGRTGGLSEAETLLSSRHSRLLPVTAGRRGLKTASGPGGFPAHPRAHPSPHRVPAPTLRSSPALSKVEAALCQGRGGTRGGNGASLDSTL